MPESIERIVRSFSVLRLMSLATLLLIAACIIISASIALADTPSVDIYEFDFEIAHTPNPEYVEYITQQEF